MIIGCDFHPSFQQIAYVDQETGEYGERRLNHREEAVGFYRSLAGRKVVLGLEATGNDRWFRKLVREKKIPRVAVGNVLDVEFFRYIPHIILENNFHNFDYIF